MKRNVVCIMAFVLFACVQCLLAQASCPVKRFREVSYPTPNIEPDTLNEVRGVVLHHTAETSIETSLELLTSLERKASSHIVIDYDGTRYILATPIDVTWHAGRSILHGREECNFFTIGIEFNGNTLEKPLTRQQIESAIEYLLPIIEEYDIPMENIVTHEMVRKAFKKEHPDFKVFSKSDITPVEYRRFMRALKMAMKRKAKR